MIFVQETRPVINPPDSRIFYVLEAGLGLRWYKRRETFHCAPRTLTFTIPIQFHLALSRSQSDNEIVIKTILPRVINFLFSTTTKSECKLAKDKNQKCLKSNMNVQAKESLLLLQFLYDLLRVNKSNSSAYTFSPTCLKSQTRKMHQDDEDIIREMIFFLLCKMQRMNVYSTASNLHSKWNNSIRHTQ